MLCTLLLAQGLLVRDAAGRLRPTAMAREFLVGGSSFDARPYYAAMADKPGVGDFLKVLRTGRPAHWPGGEAPGDWHASMHDTAFAESFTAAMDCRGRVLAPALAAAPVDRIARRAIATAGLDARIEVVAVDMFTAAWPADHDCHLFSNVLHDWDEAECRTLLAKSTAALPAGGRILIHDMLLDDDKSGPLWAAEYSVLLSTITQGRLYSAAEIGGWLADLGFTIIARAPTALGRSVLTASCS